MRKLLLVLFSVCLLLAGCSSISGTTVEQAPSTAYVEPSSPVTLQNCLLFREQLTEQQSSLHAIRTGLDDPATLDQHEEAIVRSTIMELSSQTTLVQTKLNNCLKQEN